MQSINSISISGPTVVNVFFNGCIVCPTRDSTPLLLCLPSNANARQCTHSKIKIQYCTALIQHHSSSPLQLHSDIIFSYYHYSLSFHSLSHANMAPGTALSSSISKPNYSRRMTFDFIDDRIRKVTIWRCH